MQDIHPLGSSAAVLLAIVIMPSLYNLLLVLGLRGSRVQIFGSSPTARPHPLCPLGVIIRWVLGKPKLRTKFKVASFSRCRNIKGKPQNFG